MPPFGSENEAHFSGRGAPKTILDDSYALRLLVHFMRPRNGVWAAPREALLMDLAIFGGELGPFPEPKPAKNTYFVLM